MLPLALLLTSGIQSEECAAGWSAHEGNCYKYTAESKTFEEANQLCARENSQIVVVGSEAENVFVGSLMPQEVTAWSWIAKPATFEGSAGLFEPPTFAGSCVALIHGTLGGFRWVDEDCSRQSGFICRKGSRACVKSEIGIHKGHCIRNEFKHEIGWSTFAVSHGPERVCVKKNGLQCKQYAKNPNLYSNPVLKGHPVFGHIKGGHCNCDTGENVGPAPYAHSTEFHVNPTQFKTPHGSVVHWAGGWTSTQGKGLSTVAQDGNKVDVVNPSQLWSPIDGSVDGATITLKGKTMAGEDVAMIGIYASRSIRWNDGDEWLKIGP